MKKTKLFIFAMLAMFALAFQSCDKKANNYACDDGLEEFATMNVQAFANITRTQLCQFRPDSARAIYNTLSAQKKSEIWQEKMDSVLVAGNLSQAEINLINSVKNQLSANFFQNTNDTNMVKNFGDNIYQQASALNWTEVRMAEAFTMPFTVFEMMPHNQAESGGVNCECRTRTPTTCWNGCQYEPNCIKVRGCGWFWSQECNGLC